jgi:predicted lipid-binding transport protein (Tim44 family)
MEVDMKRFTLMIATLLCFGLAMSDADAALRFGGGRSSGIQRNNVMQRQATPPAAAPAPASQAQPATPATPAPQPASGMSKWLGPLAGLALGAGLASMFMGGGGMGGIAMVLLLAVAAFFMFRMLRRPASATEPMRYSGATFDSLAPAPGAPARFDTLAPALAPVPGNGGQAAASAVSLPAGFDADGFLRQAKLNFIRLQAANDRKDLTDIRNFTTPEMFAEISLQSQERGADPQQVDVTELNAEILDVTEGAEEHLVSVRFHGTLREGPQAAPESFDEVWHLAKPANGKSGWLIAGIQQTS